MNCHDCKIHMDITPCGAAPDGPCRIHTCPKCGHSLHSKRGSPQPWVTYTDERLAKL